MAEFNGTPDDPHSYDNLDKLLDAQVYRLSHWKAADDEINYRRFFDINELAAVCMELPEVFAESHRLVFDLLARGDVDGCGSITSTACTIRRSICGDCSGTICWPWAGRATNATAASSRRLPASRRRPAAEAAPPWDEIEPAFLTQATA